MEMNELEILKVVRILVGRIQPVGETNTDNDRLDNLKKMCYVVNELVTDIKDVEFNNRGHHEFSKKRASEYAEKQLKEMFDYQINPTL